MMSARAVFGWERISDEIDARVLNRKCGLIWLLSASTFAVRSSFSCSCRRCSTRALFHILIDIATPSTVASATSAVIHGDGESRKKSLLAKADAERLGEEFECHPAR